MAGVQPAVERSDTRGHRDLLHSRTPKACEEIPVDQHLKGRVSKILVSLQYLCYLSLPK